MPDDGAMVESRAGRLDRGVPALPTVEGREAVTRDHVADALLYGIGRAGKAYRARCFYVTAVAAWAAWYRGRPWDAPYVMRFG